MAEVLKYPKRLIEVDLPIKEISAHARREKSIRHGHISTLHMWWARRPLASCRAVLCASLWPDPGDSLCPNAFLVAAREEMHLWSTEHIHCASGESLEWFLSIQRAPERLDDPSALRKSLLHFVADFANWDNAKNPEFVGLARRITGAAHSALGGDQGARPIVIDPFAGGGAIPLEALRVGADAFASDLNPVAVLLNKVILEYLPKYGQGLADNIRTWGGWVGQRAEAELGRFYPRDEERGSPSAYLWARTIHCEGPGCGAEVPLLRSPWLVRKGAQTVALHLVPEKRKGNIVIRIVTKVPGGWRDDKGAMLATGDFVADGTVKRGSATCPCCGFTTPVTRVREQLKAVRGGTNQAQLLCVVTTRDGQNGRSYRLPSADDLRAIRAAQAELTNRISSGSEGLRIMPDEELDIRGIRHTWAMVYGLTRWEDYFTARQGLALSTIARLIRELPYSEREFVDRGMYDAVRTCLALGLGRLADRCSSVCRWDPTPTASGVINTFSRQAVPMMWDFAEGVPFESKSGGWLPSLEWIALVAEHNSGLGIVGRVQHASATKHPLPDDSVDALFTDPPYYDAVPYAHLSDYFYVWIRRALADLHPNLLSRPAVPKDEEIVVDRAHELSDSTHDVAYYERELQKAFSDGRRVLRPNGIATIVFASKTTASWEAILQAVVDAGFVVTASWPIDTEMGSRVAAIGQARLASSVHLVCRPRENPDGSLRMDDVGSWRSVLAQLPPRIHEWLPRLAHEGVVGADAIFACLGPALEIYSQYSRVEKASGEVVALKEYLEQVWAAVAREALSMLFEGADASGLEEDARLTAMWLWTLGAGALQRDSGNSEAEEDSEDDEDGAPGKGTLAGFVLEYDAARKIAQGLGAHLDKLTDVVEVKGDRARLLSLSERAKHLFGKEDLAPDAPKQKKAKTSKKQLGLFAEIEAAEKQGLLGAGGVPKVGETTLNKVHQSMILFGAGRSEALKRFIVEEGVGKDGRFWKLAQSLSALYPAGSEEKRWVDGVLARKKSLGF